MEKSEITMELFFFFKHESIKRQQQQEVACPTLR